MVGYEYHPAAEAEYHAAIAYYSSVSADLGILFVTHIERAVNQARAFPEAQRRISGEMRRILTRRFPFAVIYEICEQRILIWAVAHTSRKPDYWKDRLKM